jgi:hypothetical protein
VKDAVADYGRRAPMQKVTILNVISGTASYTLPADFVKMIRLVGLFDIQAGLLNTAAGVIPVGVSFKEYVMVQGSTLVLSPTPNYSMAREMWYMAAYVLDASNVYVDMTDDVAALALLKAKALAVMAQANAAAQKSWNYTIGDETVNKTQLSAQLREQAKMLNEEYLASVLAQIGQTLRRGEAPDAFTA